MRRPPEMKSARSNLTRNLALYLHIPFCRHRCAYCDFNTYSTLGGLQSDYVSALAKEIRLAGSAAAAQYGQKRITLETVYFGGGTPSLLTVEQFTELFIALRQSFDLVTGSEISLEANPDTVDYDYLSQLRQIGFNRVSFGMQSADEAELSFLERDHDLAVIQEAVTGSRRAGFDNLNLDLIYGLPQQETSTWAASVQAALDLHPDHLSLYSLGIEPGTPLQRRLEAGLFIAPDPDRTADLFELACSTLESAGFDHYEISNWSKPARQCRHNLFYWRNNDYLAVGAGAHGQVAGQRFAVIRQPRAYIRRMKIAASTASPFSPAVNEHHLMSTSESMSNTVMMQLRLLDEGLSLSDFASRFGQSLDDAYPGVVPQMTEFGLLATDGDRLKLTERGTFLSNQVLYRFI